MLNIPNRPTLYLFDALSLLNLFDAELTLHGLNRAELVQWGLASLMGLNWLDGGDFILRC